jgi:hypothetical protein
MHRLVPLATRKWLEGLGFKWQGKAWKLLAKKFPAGNYEDWTTCQALRPHAPAVLGYEFLRETYLLDTEFSVLWHGMWQVLYFSSPV